MKLALDKITEVPRSSLEAAALIALGASGWLALLLVVAGAPIALRILAAFGFTSFCPGLALLSHMKRLGPLERGVLGVALSVSVATLLSEAMALTGTWSPTGALAGLALLSSASVALRLWRLRHPQWRLPLRKALRPGAPRWNLSRWNLSRWNFPHWHLPRGVRRWTRPVRNPPSWSKGLWPASRWRS